MKKNWCVLALSLLAAGTLAAGPVSDSLIIAVLGNAPDSAACRGPVAKKSRTGTFTFLLSFYSRYISSQDGETCTFSQTCSSFGGWAVRKKGFFEGAVLTADRLTRCNGLQPERYSIDSANGKNIDDIPSLLK